MMQTNTKQLFSMLFLALAVSGTAWFCSRTRDGEALLFYAMLSIIGIIHCFIDCKFQKRFFNLQMLGIYFFALLTGFLQSKLDGMGGMLYYIAGAEVVAIFITSEIIKWIYKSTKKN